MFIFAGEPSGDLHGSSLMAGLREQNPDLHFVGVGGPRMREQGLEEVLPMEAFDVMGYSDVFRVLPRLYKQFYFIRDKILELQPEAVLFVDYPGFNIRMAKALRKRGYKGRLIHFVCPMVWVHGKGRIKHLAANLDLLISILPFEKPLFDGTGLRVEYVGHPLAAKARDYPHQPRWREGYAIPYDKMLLGLFPGSRRAEITRNLPVQLQVAEQVKERYPDAVFALPVATPELRPLVLEALSNSELRLHHDIFLLSPESSYELMHEARAAIATSGTVTAELALHKVPTVVTYKLSWLNAFVVGVILRPKLDHYCLVNIICEKKVFPELLWPSPEPEQVAKELLALVEDGPTRNTCLEGCELLCSRLGGGDALRQACGHIGELLHV